MAPSIVAVSPTIRARLWQCRANGERQADIARRAGLHPATVSQLVNGLIPVQHGDERVLKLAAALNVPATEAFLVRRHGTDGGGR